MPDIREVYEMITKQKPSEPGALERQQKRQVRAARNKRIGAFAVAAAIAVAAVVLILEMRGGRNATRPVNEPTTVPPGKAFFLDLRTGEKRALAENLAGGHNYVASPDGTRLAYSSGQGGGCEAPGMTVANIDGTDARPLEPPKGLIMCAPRWSPDGTKLVYQVRDGASGSDVGNLFIEDLSSGRRTQLTNLKLTKAWWWFRSPSFSPDGRNVIYQLPRSSAQTTKWDVWSVPVTGGEPTLVIRNATFPMYFPDGKEVAFLSPFASDFAGQSLSIAGAQGSRRTLAEPTGAGASIWWPTMSPDGARIAYQDGGSIYVVDVSTGHSSKVADGSTAEWLDNNTLIVAVGID